MAKQDVNTNQMANLLDYAIMNAELTLNALQMD